MTNSQGVGIVLKIDQWVWKLKIDYGNFLQIPAEKVADSRRFLCVIPPQWLKSC